MFSVRQLSEQVRAVVESRLDLEQFDRWFVSSSWGHYSASGDDLSAAIASVHHVLRAHDDDELDKAMAAKELAAAIRPFEESVVSPRVYAPYRIRFGQDPKPPAISSIPWGPVVQMARAQA